MAAAVVSSPIASTSSKKITDEEGRWVTIGICLNKVLTPVLRKVLGNEIPKWYQTLAKPPAEIDKQTYGKFVKNLLPSTIKLNYDSINNNTVHKSSKLYDYAVKDPLSLAKLFMKPFMATFTGFDHTMDTSAVLSVMCEAQPFIACGADVLAKKVRSDIRNEWAHCDFSHWTQPKYQSALNDIQSLVKAVGLTTADKKNVLDDIDDWRNNGIKLCYGNLVDCELLDLIRTEVGNLQESVTLFNEDSKDKEKLLCCLDSFQTSLSKDICELRDRQALTDEKVDQMQMQLEQLSFYNKYVSTVQDVKEMKIKAYRIASSKNEIPYKFLAPNKNTWFGGRLSELKDLANLLQFDDACQSKVNTASVCGLGGVGKTSLAIEYAHQKKDYYTGGVYWFCGQDDNTFENSVYDVATRFGTQNDSFGLTFSATLATICRIKSPWLVVLDNMDQFSLSSNIVKLVSGSWQRDASGHLLITTRRKPNALANDIRDFDEKCCLSLKCFEIEEGRKFLFRRIEIIHDKEEDIVAAKLVEKLGGLPLALEQAGAYINSLQCTLSQYLEQYDKQRLRLLNQQKATRVSEYDSSERLAVRTTWHLNFEHIKQTDDDGQAAGRFLNASAFLSSNEIQNDIINVGKPAIEDEEFCECVKTALGRQQVLKLLTDFSLFKMTLSSNLSVHHLVQEVIKENLNPEEEIQSIIDAIRMLHYAFQSCSSPDELLSSVSSERQKRPSMVCSSSLSHLYKWHKLCLHSYELVKHIRRVVMQLHHDDGGRIFQPETARIVYECAIHLSANSKHAEAKEVVNLAKDIFNLSNQQVVASSVFPHSIPLPELVCRHIQYSCNTPETSEKDECRDVGIPVHPVPSEQLEEMRMKGNDFFKKGSYLQALKMYSDAISLSKSTASFDPRLLTNRASVYLKLGQYEEALHDAEEYILQRPKCWRGYARKVLALVELNTDLEGVYLAASLALYYQRDIFQNFQPFKSKLDFLPEMHPFVCRNSEGLQTALRKARDLDMQNQVPAKPNYLPVIILEPGNYLITLHANKMLCIGNCILVGGGDKCSVTFDNIHVDFIKLFIAYNVNFSSTFTNCHFQPDSVVKLVHCSFTSSNHTYQSFCCQGKLKVDSCKFGNCTKGGLLVVGDAEVENSEFYGNGAGGLEVRDGGRLVVKKCRMYANRQGLLIGPKVKECVVEDCELYDNQWGGIVVGNSQSEVSIRRNYIHDNDEPGIAMLGHSSAHVLENEILNNSHWGITVKNYSQAFIHKNKIHNNRCGGICLEVMSSKGKSVIENNDISYNSGPGICEKGLLSECRGNMLKDNEEGVRSTAGSAIKFCYYCKKPEKDLKKCSNCFTAQYCGRKCQKSDWKNHKEACNRLLSDGSIFVKYTNGRGKFHYFRYIKQPRSLFAADPDPKYCKPTNTTTWIIVKIEAGFAYKECNPGKEVDRSVLRVYDRSLTINGFLIDAERIYTLVWQHGTIGHFDNNNKKLFMWVKGPEHGKILVFANAFPPPQDW